MTQISPQEVEVFRVLSANRHTWLSNTEIAARVAASPRLVRAVTRKLAGLGVLEQIEDVYPGYRFRRARTTSAEGRAYLARLSQAADVMSQDTIEATS